MNECPFRRMMNNTPTLKDEKKRIETKCGRNKCSISLEEGSRMPPP
jgi:hypothetical protein